MPKEKANNLDFKEFYEQYFDRIYIFLSGKISSKEEAKDLVQDVFIKIFQNWKRVQQAPKLDSYIFTIVRNTLIDYYRKSTKITPLEEINLQEEKEIQISSENNTPSKEQLLLLHKAIESLPEQRKQIIKLKKLHGLSTEEIACDLSLSKRTVENQVFRAMTTLREKMANYFSIFF